MESVISCRLNKPELEFLDLYSKERGETKGGVLRELVEEGRKMEALKLYKQGKASLGKAARIAGLTMSEMLDLIAEFGVKTNVTLGDFRDSLLNAHKLIVKR